jgi:hypothetical protein
MGKKYITGDKPLFDEAYVKYKDRSDILRRKNNNVFKPSLDKQNCKNLINGLQEQIPLLKEELAEILTEFKNHQQRRINEGWHKPTKMPPEMEKSYWDLEARINVREDEVLKLQQILDEFQKEIDDKHKAEVLKDGAEGSSQLRDGIVWKIDGQKVSVIKGWPVIDEQYSPFDGMRVADYRQHVCTRWNKKKKEIQDAFHKKEEEACKKEGRRFNESAFFSLKVPVDKTWPQGVKNWKKEDY